MDLPSLPLLVLLPITCTFILILTSNFRPWRSAKLPPGPYPLPTIGNILEIGSKPHQSLAKLAGTYGPLMSLKLGSVTTIVVSSADIAKEVLQRNALATSNRPVPGVATSLDHDKFSMGWLPVQNEKWRKLRKICKEHLFSVLKLEDSRALRTEQVEKLSNYLKECSRKGSPVDVSLAGFTMSTNLMSATLFSKEFASFDSGSSQEMKDLVWGVVGSFGKQNLSDYFPVLRSIDPQGVLKETKFYFQKIFEAFDGIIDEKLKSRARGEKACRSDMVEALLDLHLKDEPELSRNDINHLLFDLFVAGMDTTSGVVTWAMAELLRSPDKMSRLRNEIMEIVGQKEHVQESDIPKLPYLQAVVKETFRLHPTAVFLMPRKADSEMVINGYTIPKNAQFIVNLWASGRDFKTWSNADLFSPERFLNDKEIDYQGFNFELIPFGAGRRICPGLPLAHRMVHLMLATFVHKFAWKHEGGISPEEIDMTEKFGLTLQKAIPLKAIPVELYELA